MALGARKPAAHDPASVTLQQRTFTGPSEVFLGGGAPVESDRLEALRQAREQYLGAQRAKERRKTRRRSYRKRKRLTWRERAFMNHD